MLKQLQRSRFRYTVECMIKSHKPHPLHRTEFWNGRFFERRALWDCGPTVHFGHGGLECPSWRGRAKTKEDDGAFVILDRNGIHKVRVRWCKCRNAPSQAGQLLRASLYPGSHRIPSTAYTFDLLDYMLLDNLETLEVGIISYKEGRGIVINTT